MTVNIFLPFGGPGAVVLHEESDLHLQTEDVLVLPGPLLVSIMREEFLISQPAASVDSMLLGGVIPTSG